MILYHHLEISLSLNTRTHHHVPHFSRIVSYVGLMCVSSPLNVRVYGLARSTVYSIGIFNWQARFLPKSTENTYRQSCTLQSWHSTTAAHQLRIPLSQISTSLLDSPSTFHLFCILLNVHFFFFSLHSWTSSSMPPSSTHFFLEILFAELRNVDYLFDTTLFLSPSYILHLHIFHNPA